MSIATLVTILLKHVAFLVAGAFTLLTISPVQDINFRQDNIRNKLFLICFFGVFGILGTYSGNAIFNSIANLRAMAVITAGLFAGPRVGLGAGLIAGGHRFLIDPWGFSALPCAISTICEGLAAGIFHDRKPKYYLDWRVAALFGFSGEIVHMLIVLFFSPPFHEAMALVQVIALPMIIGNSLGAGLFVHVIQTISEFREKSASSQTQKIFAITTQTVRHLRDGLQQKSAQATAEIIYHQLPVSAVAITDTQKVLAHVGEGHDHHLCGGPIITKSTHAVLQDGHSVFSKKAHEIGCNHPGCPFQSAIIAPLRKGDKIVGTLKLYGNKKKRLNSIQFEIGKGLSDLFSIQLELEDIEIKDRMLSHAEIRHLQAQINPHFLFNSLNTIASFCRTAPDKARELILDLSFYMRKNMDSSRGFIRLADEIAQIESYLAIEKARFGKRISMELHVESDCQNWPIPSLTIQPLIENAIRHGLRDKIGDGKVSLTICQHSELLHVTVADNGLGMEPEKVQEILARTMNRSQANGLGGIGLQNSNQRLKQIYGAEYAMHISSTIGVGTTISFSVPKQDELNSPSAVQA